MGRIEKTVFLSYRRTNFHAGLLIFQDLTRHGYDVFFDYEGLASGDFEQGILENIRSRAHFLVLLTPSALERCSAADDWLRREIETALETRRNIVPLLVEGFDFGSPPIANQLTGRLADLRRYNGLEIPAAYFEAAMERLRSRYLNVAVDMVLHSASVAAREIAAEQKAAANGAPAVEEEKLTAQQYFECGLAASDDLEKVRLYSEAIRLSPLYADAFSNRGDALYRLGEWDKVIWDTGEALRLNPKASSAYINRGLALQAKGDVDGALRDYDEALRLDPKDEFAYNNRGSVRRAKGDLDGALRDYDEALRLNPKDAIKYTNRGLAYRTKGDLDGALRDYDEAIRLNPKYVDAYVARGIARYAKGDLHGALRDYDEAIRLNPSHVNAYVARGNSRQSKGDLDGSLRDYDEALRLNPKYALAYNNRGYSHEKQGKIDLAIGDYEEALRHDPQQVNAISNLAKLRKKN